jgi:hypothetical protein
MAGYAGGKDRDPTGRIGSDRTKADSAKGTAGGVGSRLAQQGQASHIAAPGSAQAADKNFKAEGGSVQNGRAVRAGDAGGGAATAPSEPKRNLPTGVTPLSEPKPMGATPYVEGADWLGKAARFLGGIGGAVGSALTQGITGEDPTQSMFGEHLGKQTGWSADPSMTPGRDRAQRGTSRESFDQTTIGSATSTAGGDEAGKAAPLPTDDFSDIQMNDRRKPGLKQMLETML